jgi:hypothetical protein
MINGTSHPAIAAIEAVFVALLMQWQCGGMSSACRRLPASGVFELWQTRRIAIVC